MATVGVHVQGLRTVNRKLKELPQSSRDKLIKRSGQIAVTVGDRARLQFVALGRQGPLVAGTLRSTKGTVPTIKVGGSKRLGKNRKPAYKLLWGTEFGANKYKQFHAAHTGRIGRALYPTIRRNEAYMYVEWRKVLDQVVNEFDEGFSGRISGSLDDEEIV
jgi:hypothetical protein